MQWNKNEGFVTSSYSATGGNEKIAYSGEKK
jgi:hypothetical protein